MSFWFTLLLVLFLIVVALLWIGVTIISPEVGLILVSSLAFGLFAYRLLAAYTFVIAAADYFKETGELKDIQKMAQKSGKSEEELQQLPLSAILALILAALEPFRYTFYFGFVIVLLFSLAVSALPPFVELRTFVEAIFWGSALTTFIVWAFENFAEAAVAEVAELEQQQLATQGQAQQAQQQQSAEGGN